MANKANGSKRNLVRRNMICYNEMARCWQAGRVRKIMYIVDDSTLALMTRFIGDAPNLEWSDAGYLLQQIAAIERYIDGFPADERQARVLEWIAAYARQYRQQWQKQAVVDAVAHTRCADCPLAEGDRSTPCPVHTRWLKLLQDYANDELSSPEYVEAALKLLNAYKNRLAVGRTRRQWRQPALDH